MNKTIKLLFCTAMTVLVLTACGKNLPETPAEPEVPAVEPETPVEPEAPVHTHEAENWDRNLTDHWQLCQCGETFHAGAHALGEDLICTDCGSEVWDHGDGSGSVYNYSEYGDWIRMTDYDAEGNILFDQVYEIEYDADGSKLRETVYANDILTEEWVYAEGGVPQKQTGYFDDGTWSVNEYDENGNVVHSVSYNAEGGVEVEDFTEYTKGADGWLYESKYTVAFSDGTRQVTERNEYGDQTAWRVYLADGTLETAFINEYTYDENGNMLWKKTDYSGERVDETFYTYNEDGNLFLEELISTDGSRYLCEYWVDEDGWSQCAREVLTEADGTYIVREYDEDEEVISEIRYDAEGNEIPMEPEEAE